MKDSFDDYIEGKLNQRQFDFDEENWFKAAQLLDQEEDKRRGFFWLKFASGLLLLITIAGIGFYVSTDKGLSLETVQTTKTTPSLDIQNDYKDVKDETHTADEVIAEIKTSKTDNTFANISSATASTFKNVTATPTLKNKHFALIEKPTLTNDQFDQGNTRKNNSQISTIPTSQNVLDTKLNLNKLLSIFNTLGLVDFNLSPNYLDEDLLKHNPSIKTAHPKFSIAVKASILGMSGQQFSKHIGFTGGLIFSLPIAAKLDINSGINYVNQSIDLQQLVTASKTVYTFGKVESTELLKADRLHTIEIPLYLSYRVSPKSKINIGGSFSKLFRVSGKVHSNTNNTTTIVDEGRIDTDAYSTTYLNGLLGYDYKINKRFVIGASANYNFSKIINQSFMYPEGVIQSEPSKLRFGIHTKIRLY